MDAAYKFSRESIDFLVNPFIGVSRFYTIGFEYLRLLCFGYCRKPVGILAG